MTTYVNPGRIWYEALALSQDISALERHLEALRAMTHATPQESTRPLPQPAGSVDEETEHLVAYV
jgi:hypothetical protein